MYHTAWESSHSRDVTAVSRLSASLLIGRRASTSKSLTSVPLSSSSIGGAVSLQ